jgi:hypothetical protein
MIVTTIPSLYGKTMSIWDQQEIKFDHTGKCKVDDKLGKELLNRYPEFVFPEEGNKERKKTVEQEINQELVNRLNGEIYDLKNEVKEVKSAKESVEADLKEWQDKVGSLIDQAKASEIQVKNEQESVKKQKEYFELKISLMESNRDALKKLCEDSQYDKKEWEMMTKEKLIEYIMSK